MTATPKSHGHARQMGARAGEAAKASGVPERCPFDQQATPDLYRTWSAAYTAAAYKR